MWSERGPPPLHRDHLITTGLLTPDTPTVSGVVNGGDLCVETDVQSLGERGRKLVIAFSQSQMCS